MGENEIELGQEQNGLGQNDGDKIDQTAGTKEGEPSGTKPLGQEQNEAKRAGTKSTNVLKKIEMSGLNIEMKTNLIGSNDAGIVLAHDYSGTRIGLYNGGEVTPDIGMTEPVELDSLKQIRDQIDEFIGLLEN